MAIDEKSIIDQAATALMKGIEIKSVSRKHEAWLQIRDYISLIRKQLRGMVEK